MRYAIPLLGDRVAPRCTFADSILLVTVGRDRILERSTVPLDGNTWADLARVLSDQRVDTMVCGGIGTSTRESIRSRDVDVIENVAGRSDEIVEALERGRLRAGYGLSRRRDLQEPAPQNGDRNRRVERRRRRTTGAARPGTGDGPINCLTCEDRVCLRGERCPFLGPLRARNLSPADEEILRSAMDVACEEERALCRLAELVYFSLGMEYKRIGIAFCIDLLEPATVLAKVLQRFFDVFPVGCKIGGIPLEEPGGLVGGLGDVGVPRITACDPSGQAAVLNSLETDLNVIVGLCVGVDCVFTGESHAPVTTIFVKDKSLANNPVGAVYSHYYLKDI
jgi:uncharacterized metal-binding protein/predicted Fe-Mo cluster-binding NifX family protein